MPLNPSNSVIKNHGCWKADRQLPGTGNAAWTQALRNLAQPLYVVDMDGQPGVVQDGQATLTNDASGNTDVYPLIGWARHFHRNGWGMPASGPITASDWPIFAVPWPMASPPPPWWKPPVGPV
nr:hypothetical protein [Desulfosarcina cetonica]